MEIDSGLRQRNNMDNFFDNEEKVFRNNELINCSNEAMISSNHESNLNKNNASSEYHSTVSMKKEKERNEQAYFHLKNNKVIDNIEKWIPFYTPNYLILIYIFIGITFITIGILLQILSNNTIECIINYEDSPGNGKVIDTIVEIKSEHCNPSTINGNKLKYLKGDFFIYYQLRNFYQNNKSFIFSKSERQLSGELIYEEETLSDCYPIIKDKQGKIFYPCGVATLTIFNDTFTILDGQNDPIEIDDSVETITFKSDRVNYKNIPEHELLNHKFNDWLPKDVFPGRIENPHFIVWMKFSAFSNFNKIYGKLNSKKNKLILPLKIHVKNRYPVHFFNGSKHIVISQSTIFGGKNYYFGILYIISGILFILLSIYYIIRNRFNTNILGDFRFLYWNNT